MLVISTIIFHNHLQMLRAMKDYDEYNNIPLPPYQQEDEFPSLILISIIMFVIGIIMLI